MTLREQLIVVWFGSRSDTLRQVLNDEQHISEYETKLRGVVERETLLVAREPPAPTRDAAFRRVVTQIYDYRCAASGWRIILPDSRSMIEAAHLIPFSESHDDDPRNGIALVPSLHWALDAQVIAPGPDYKWHVSACWTPGLPTTDRYWNSKENRSFCRRTRDFGQRGRHWNGACSVSLRDVRPESRRMRPISRTLPAMDPITSD